MTQFLHATTAYREPTVTAAEVNCTFVELPRNAAIALDVSVFESISQDLHCQGFCARTVVSPYPAMKYPATRPATNTVATIARFIVILLLPECAACSNANGRPKFRSARRFGLPAAT